jgi:hypothetical protein
MAKGIYPEKNSTHGPGHLNLEAGATVLATATTRAIAAGGPITVVITGAGFVDAHFATHPLSAIEGFDDGVFLGFSTHIYKGKTTGTPGFAVDGKADAANFTVFVKDAL